LEAGLGFQQMKWQDVKQLFRWDGSWRDIYISNADAAVHQLVIDAVRNRYTTQYNEDGKHKPFPQSIMIAVDQRAEVTPCLSIYVEGIRINTHFFLPDKIAFDIDPREIDSEEKFAALTEFMRYIGQHSERDVVLSPEGGAAHEEMLIAYHLQDDSWKHAEEFVG
jgi:hypothetical protein